MSIYHEDFVSYRNTMRFESKPCVSRQHREIWKVYNSFKNFNKDYKGCDQKKFETET